MDSDEDICVLQSSPESSRVTFTQDLQPPIHFSPLPSPLISRPLGDFERASFCALQQAFNKVSSLLQESKAQNRELSRRVQDLEAEKFSIVPSSISAESYDMMEDAAYSSRGQGSAAAAGLQQSAADQLGAEQGYNAKLQRELLQTKTQLEGVQEQSNKMIASLNKQLHEAQGKVATLSQDKAALQQSLDNLAKRCESLQIEKEKVIKEEASLHLSLQKANQEVAILKEKQADSLTNEPPAEFVTELANMRKVIDSLKRMVLMQRQYLEQRGMSMSSMGRSLRSDNNSVQADLPPLSTQGPGSRGSGGSSCASWELVNGNASTRQQQGTPKRPLTSSASTGSNVSPRGSLTPKSSLNGIAEAGKVINNVGVAQNGIQGGVKMAGGVSNGVGGMRSDGTVGVRSEGMEKAKTDFIQRRKSEDEIVQRPTKSKTEVIRSNTSPSALAPTLGTWMQQVSGSSHPAGMAGPAPYSQAGSAGLNQIWQLRPGGGGVESGRRVQGPGGPNVGLQNVDSPGPYRPELSSTYDNLVPGNSALSSNNNTTNVPSSIHIFNTNACSGARVVQSCSSEYAARGGSNIMVQATHTPGLATGMNRDSGGGGEITRGLPQEHIDMTTAANPVNLDLNQFQPIHFENEINPGMETSTSTLDRKCPVCGQDFSLISMDEFQTHVFECFDDAEESNAPETLLPQNHQAPKSAPPSSAEKICPMCHKKYPESVSQEFFEGHVQSHFEEVDAFEVLPRP